MNLRPLGYEPSELPSCSTPRRCVHNSNHDKRQAQIEPHHTARPSSRDSRLPPPGSPRGAGCHRARSREGSRSPAHDGPPPGAVLPEADGAAAGARSPGHHGAAAWHSSPPTTTSQPAAAGCAGGRPSPGSVMRITRHTNATGPRDGSLPRVRRQAHGPAPCGNFTGATQARLVRERCRGPLDGPARTRASAWTTRNHLARGHYRSHAEPALGEHHPDHAEPRARRRHRSRPPQPGTEAADEAPAPPRTRAPGDARAGSGAGRPGPSGPASQEALRRSRRGAAWLGQGRWEPTRGALVRGHHQGNAGPLAQSATRAARSRLEREGCHQRGRTARCTTKAAWTPRTRRHQSRSHPRPPHPRGPATGSSPYKGTTRAARRRLVQRCHRASALAFFPPDTRRGPHGVPGRGGAPTPTAPHAGRRGASRRVRPPPPGPVPPRGRTRTVPPPVRRGGR